MLNNRQMKVLCYPVMWLTLLTARVYSATSEDVHDNSAFIHQQLQQQAKRQQLTAPVPDVRLSVPPSASPATRFPDESPCFVIQRVEILQRDSLPHWLPLERIAARAMGHCLGVAGIRTLTDMLQNRIIASGLSTSRVLLPVQNLSSGVLRLQIIAGYTGQIRLSQDSQRYISLYNALPQRSGDLFDLRDTEQGMENLQRLPTVQAQVQIVPGQNPGESDIVISRQQSCFWRLGLSLDNSGTSQTGRYQGSVTLWLDNPLSFSDAFWLSASHDPGFHGNKSSQSVSAYYSVPLGYWLASLYGAQSAWLQTVAGYDDDYRYRGRQKNLELQLSRMLHRDERQKTTLSYGLLLYEAQQFINDARLDVQQRRTSAWRVSLAHRHYTGSATVDGQISYRQGVRWFGALPAPEEYMDEASALSRILRFDLSLNLPFTLYQQQLRFNSSYSGQRSQRPLTPPEQFSIGSRWTVRGFDSERSLNANNGSVWRNELAWLVAHSQQELYLAADYGRVSGYGSELLSGQHLAGMALGLRGQLSRYLRYDVFIARPLSQPDRFSSGKPSAAFSLNMEY